ncbi:DNA cytosine methyltransferase [Streptomyces sp. MS2A]|nr:DNA cytosine methyltransferase [Streptomyces sp. MS2A]
MIAAPGHRDVKTSRQNAPGSVRVTFEEAAALQSFPSDFVWKGTKTARFQIVGNAVPPLMAEAILRSLLTPAEELGVWDQVFAEVAG